MTTLLAFPLAQTTIPTIDTLAQVLTVLFALFGALLAAFWFSLVIWSFRDMRLRSRDPFAQILAALLVGALPFIGIFIYLILRPPETLAERYERALEEEALLQEIEERPRCYNCSRTVQEAWVVCPKCQVELKKQCPSCYNLLELGWKVCPMCATEQPEERQPLNRKLLRKRLLPQPIVVQSQIQGRNTQQPQQPAIGVEQRPQRVMRRRYRTAEIGENGNGEVKALPGRLVIGTEHPTVVRVSQPSDTVPILDFEDDTRPIDHEFDTEPSLGEADDFSDEPTYFSEPKPQRIQREKQNLPKD
jgi:RNA polymerase subunit RPABC4/transcription elongation factor Spt4